MLRLTRTVRLRAIELAIALSSVVWMDVVAEVTVRRGLSYSETIPSLSLDLYTPSEISSASPCIVVIQGGGFSAQTGEKFRPFAERLAQEGFAAALIAYRGRPNHEYRDTVADTKTAVRFIRKMSGEFGIDPDRIGAMGRSAGGTLVALLALTDDAPKWRTDGSHSEYSSRIQAGVAYAGVFDFVGRFENERQIALQPNVETKILSNGEWIGKPYSKTDPDWQTASATTHLDREDPPLLLMHCKDDATVPWFQSQDLYERMKQMGVPAEIELYETGGHGFRTKDADAPIKRMVAFFRERL